MSNNETGKKSSVQNKVVLFGAILAAIAVIIVIVILFENRSGSIEINNKTSYKLESITTRFIYDLDGQESLGEMDFGSINSKTSVKEKIDDFDLFALNAKLEVRFQFEGMDKVLIDAGNFNEVFKGDIKVVFENDEDGIIKIKVKAKNRGFGSYLTDCNEEYYLDIEKGYVLE